MTGSRCSSLGIYTPGSDVPSAQRLGRSDYSYHFVARYFERALRDVVPVDVVGTAAGLGATGQLDLLFLPPHRLPDTVRPGAAAVDVFAWEYDTIPTQTWNDDPRNDWRDPLGIVRGAITHSRFAADAVARAIPDLRVASIPAPVWDDFAPLANQERPEQWRIGLHGWVIDSWRHGLDTTSVMTGASPAQGERDVHLTGPVYTLVANPDDSRKNWVDAFSAFAEAFRDDPDVTLLIKLVHPDGDRAFDLVADMLYRPAPYRCRVVVVFGHLDDDSYRTMVAGSAFVVNASRGEGQCLPLMEFMSAGVPAIAPDHTAMAEYVTVDNAFIVTSSGFWTHWPHDPRRMLRCQGRRIDWDSLHDAYLASRVVLTSEDEYRAMRQAASQSLRRFASRQTFLTEMARFLPEVGGPELDLGGAR